MNADDFDPLLQAQRAGTLDSAGARQLDMLLASRLHRISDGPPPPWREVWTRVRVCARSQRRRSALAGTAMATTLAAIVYFGLQESPPNPGVVFGGLGVAFVGSAWSVADSLRRGVGLSAIANDAHAELFVAMRQELQRERAFLERALLPLSLLLVVALATLLTLLELDQPRVLVTAPVIVGVLLYLQRERWVTLPRLRRECDALATED